VVSAFPLSAAQRQALTRWLSERIGRDITLSEQVDERLVAGLTITLGSLVLDGSLASKVRQAARRAHHASGS
jgi:F-type H+-transporting ATPase subunit delta